MAYTHSAQRPKRRQHPADIEAAEQIARVTSFSVVFSKGPSDRKREDTTDRAEAYAIADRLNAEHGQNGRRACVYGITPEGRAWPLPATFTVDAGSGS